ncbi:MAG: tripartite tricarboxylate transporter substrate binding protein, partial [Clostridia bacterium]|nr:tripartite tricarboxylate transporter substrate binding protein [Clostridia bacterium]
EEIVFPTKPITLVVPFAAGGISDTLSRAIAEVSKNYLDQPINVVNREGGSATVGTNEVITAKPDGYTLLFGSSGELASGMHLVQAPYNMDSYTPLCQIGSMRGVLAVNKDAPWSNLEEFIAYAKERPGEVTIGVPGKGNVITLVAHNFCRQAGIELNFVPFQGSGPVIPALLGGHVDVAILNVPEISGQYNAGEAGILAVFSEQRIDVIKDVPTAIEQGFDIVGGASHFITAPNGVPEEVAQIIRDAMKKVTEDPKFIETTSKMGYEIIYNGDTEACKAFLKDWHETAGEIYKELGMI